MTEQAEHSHPNYVKIWGILLALLVVSVLGPLLGIKAVTLVAAFGIAIVKALMVAAHFMHLNIEKRIIWYLLIVVLLCLLVLFSGVAPDVMKKEGQNGRHPSASQPAPSP